MAMVVALVCAAIAAVRWHLFPSWLAAVATLAATLTLIDSVPISLQAERAWDHWG